MNKETLKEIYLDRVKNHEFSFKIELAVGTFEIYGHLAIPDNEIDYAYFLNQELVLGGRYKNELWKDCQDFEWDLLVLEALENVATDLKEV